ncbi:MAG TPA: ABC transporter substrate-binding protein [Bacillales bacterium]|nr:ABC transporter substrate-binding protein [Bacillales bacterium]
MKHKKWNFRTIVLSLFIIPMLVLAGCGNNTNGGGSANSGKGGGYSGKIVFADAQWDSIELHNWIARWIIEKGYGIKTGVKSGSTAATFLGFRQGDIDVYMEVWTSNIKDVYQEALKSGDIKKVSVNYDDDKQGFFVPTYMIKGDPKRGIKATAPDLKSVKDLPKYWKLFKDPSDPSKGRIVGAPSGWEVDKILQKQVKAFGLDKTYNYFRPGSSTALTTSLSTAYKNGKPWIGYYWGPTWVLGKYDMTLLKEPKHTKKCWNTTKACAFPKVPVVVAVNSDFAKEAPKVVKFLSHYKTSADLTNAGLAQMQAHSDAKNPAKVAAKIWLNKHTDLWTKWVPDNVAKKVKKAIQ